jgi:hypothetical protein
MWLHNRSTGTVLDVRGVWYLKLLSEVLDHVSKPHQISALDSLYNNLFYQLVL